MAELNNLLDNFTTTNINISVIPFIINLLIAAILGHILNVIYAIFGRSISNRKDFGKNFILIILSTVLIITVVKSSLALSLGLVGALSIVRFRAAIKEPEELSYIFFAIGIGLGLGADQTKITIITFIIIIIVLGIKSKFLDKTDESKNLQLTIESDNRNNFDTQQIINILENTLSSVNIVRIGESENIAEILAIIEIEHIGNIYEMKKQLYELNSKLSINVLDNKGII